MSIARRKLVTGVLAGGLLLALPAGAAQDGALDWSVLPLTGIDGAPLAAELFRGKAVMVVNTASLCGFTRQYAGLQKLWQDYRDRGLVVLGVPSSDFGDQEPGDEATIKKFCEVNFGIDFPMTEKAHVRGAQAHPLYRWAAAQTGPEGVPQWNFHKLLIGRDGRLAAWFPSRTEPEAAALRSAVEAALR